MPDVSADRLPSLSPAAVPDDPADRHHSPPPAAVPDDPADRHHSRPPAAVPDDFADRHHSPTAPGDSADRTTARPPATPGTPAAGGVSEWGTSGQAAPVKVLLLGGTGEARRLADLLATEPDLEVVSSLAGRTAEARLPAGAVRQGGFGGVEGLVAWLTTHEVDAVVDATHPFAATMTAHAAAACHQTGTPLLVLRRPGWTPIRRRPLAPRPNPLRSRPPTPSTGHPSLPNNRPPGPRRLRPHSPGLLGSRGLRPRAPRPVGLGSVGRAPRLLGRRPFGRGLRALHLRRRRDVDLGALR